jgi:signal peptidase II
VTPAATRVWVQAGVLAALVVVLDQVAKAIIEDQLVPGQDVDVAGPVNLTLSHNKGVAFGLAGGGGVLLLAFTLGALALIVYLFAQEPQRRGMWIAVGLLVGGAIGNLVDRIRAGEVTDFIAVGSWPPFNVADVAITLGVAVLAWAYLREAEA